MAFSDINFEMSPQTFFALQTGFSDITLIPPGVYGNSIGLSDVGGNVVTFAITNASLEDISGTMPSLPLTFPTDTWTANETFFYFGIERANIRINFDISGTVTGGNPFSKTYIEATPTLNLIP